MKQVRTAGEFDTIVESFRNIIVSTNEELSEEQKKILETMEEREFQEKYMKNMDLKVMYLQFLSLADAYAKSERDKFDILAKLTWPFLLIY